jgi:E3 ubiquitin-protein ligase KCMF1
MLIQNEFIFIQQAARQQLERLPRRTHPVVTSTNSANGIGGASSQQPNSVITFNANTIGTSSNPLPLAAAATSNINGALACLTGGSGLRGVIGSGLAGGIGGVGAVGTGVSGVSSGGNDGGASEAARNAQSQFLMARFMVPTLEEAELAQLERDRADR